MPHLFISRNTFVLFLLAASLLISDKSFAQRDPDLISSRNYIGIEAGLNYTWLPGSQNYYFTFGWPFTDPLATQSIQPVYLINPGSGLGFQFGGTLDLSFSDFLGLNLKLQYRQHATSTTEDSTINTTAADGSNPGTADIEKTFRTRLGFLGIDAALRLQFVKESWYGLVGFGYSALISDEAAVHEKILSSTNNTQWLFLPSRTQSGSTEFDIPFGKTNSYFNSSQIAAKIGVGTFIPLSGKDWVLTPELELAIPLSEWVSSNFQTDYSNHGATPPKMWYASLSIALKFPFGATSREDMETKPVGSKPEESDEGYAHLKGKVTDRKTGKPVHANVTVTDLNSNDVVSNTKTDDDGEYNVRVKAPGRYSVTADADGYLFGSTYYEVDPEGRILRGNHNLVLDEATGRTRLLIFFDIDKAELQRSSYPELDRVVHLMQANPNMEVEIAGYTDATGSDAYNLDLSVRRANAVRDYLLRHDITNSRIVPKGYGKDNPVSSNDTEEGRADNRRVEFVVLHK
jgi:outer membrane protein OmpA-like peptidoglycan-associated protein